MVLISRLFCRYISSRVCLVSSSNPRVIMESWKSISFSCKNQLNQRDTCSSLWILSFKTVYWIIDQLVIWAQSVSMNIISGNQIHVSTKIILKFLLSEMPKRSFKIIPIPNVQVISTKGNKSCLNVTFPQYQ